MTTKGDWFNHMDKLQPEVKKKDNGIKFNIDFFSWAKTRWNT